MNPFTESTLARPLNEVRTSPSAESSAPVGCKKRRSLVGMTLGAMGLATSMGLAPGPGLTPLAGAGIVSGLGLVAGLALPALAHAVDVNAATQTQLQTIRGIGPKTAKIIIEERTRGGRYESFEDLSDRVKGIGPKKAESLHAAGLTLGGKGAPPAKPKKK